MVKNCDLILSIGFGLASIIFVCFFLWFFYQQYKHYKKNKRLKEAKELIEQIDNDVEYQSTLTAKEQAEYTIKAFKKAIKAWR